MYDSDAIEEEDNPLLIHLVAGCIAGAIEATATWPFEYIKTQLQLLHRPAKALLLSELPGFDEDGIMVSNETVQVVKCESADEEVEPDLPVPYTGMISGIVYTVREHGFSALYHGLSPTLLGSIPKAGIRFGLFAWFSALLSAWQGNNLSATAIYFLAGLGAGAIEALVVVTPVETIKTKCIQLNMSFLEGLREILILEGIRGIYHGLVPTVLKQGSVSGTILSLCWRPTASYISLFVLCVLASCAESRTSFFVLLRVQAHRYTRWSIRYEPVPVVRRGHDSRNFFHPREPAI